MALVLADRVQETTTTSGTGSITLAGAVAGFQSFAVIGNGNSCFYTIVDGTDWEVGIGTYSTTGPTLARTTVLSNSNGNTSPITLSGSLASVFVTYPAEKSVNVDGGSTVNLPGALVLNGTINSNSNPFVGGIYDGNQFYPTNGSGAQVNSLRDGFVTVNVGTAGSIAKTTTFDINGNVLSNNFIGGYAAITSSGGTTVLTAASAYYQRLGGSSPHTFQLPDATTLALGQAFVFDNDSSQNLFIIDNASNPIDTVPSGGYGYFFVEANSTSAGSWGKYALLPATYDFSTGLANFGGATINNATWNGGLIDVAYGGTGLTSFTANGAVYANSSSTLTTGTLPATSGGTGFSSFTVGDLLYANTTSTLAKLGIGANNYVLTSDGSTISWASVPSSMVYPASGIPVSTGSAWTTSKTAPSGAIVGTTDSQTLTNKQWQAYNETCTTVGTVSTSTYNIDLSLSNIFDITLGTNVTFTFTNPPASGISRNCTVILRQDATGNRLATFTNAKYTDGTAPILSTGANQIDVLTFFTLNGGSFWFGTFAMANVS